LSSAASHAHDDNPHLAEHFQSVEQQEEACTLGMWLFLAQEVMFFGGMFAAYGVYRFLYTEAFVLASHSLDVSIGALNTVILLLSSFTVAMSVYHTQVGNIRKINIYLGITLVLGFAFVVIKWFFEYSPKIAAGVFPGKWWTIEATHPYYGELAAFPEHGVQMFFVLYYIMTGMHALHMFIGFGIIAVLMVMTARGKFGPHRYLPIMFFGLYWHFVDIVWVFLFPLFYLVH